MAIVGCENRGYVPNLEFLDKVDESNNYGLL
jgi:hypothetical protein